MAKCATCVFHENDKHMENAWFLANYNEAKTMRCSNNVLTSILGKVHPEIRAPRQRLPDRMRGDFAPQNYETKKVHTSPAIEQDDF